MSAPYSAPAKCEGRVPGDPDVDEPAPRRCQAPPMFWNEKAYAWLCATCDRRAK